MRKEAEIKYKEQNTNRDTPRRYAIENMHKCLELLAKAGHKDGEKYRDYIKIAENEDEEEQTIAHLMKAAEVVDKAVDAYWEEMAVENKYDEMEQDRERGGQIQKIDEYQEFAESQ